MKKLIRLIQGFLNAMNDDHVGAYAAQTAYFIMLSFVPFILLFVTLIQYTSVTAEDVYRVMQTILPDNMDSFVLGIIQEVYSKGALTISLSAVTAAWSAGKSFMSLIGGMNTIYNVEEKRNYFILRLRSALYTVVFVIAIILSLVGLVFGDSLHEMAKQYAPFIAIITGVLIQMKSVIMLGFLIIFFMVLYRFVPNRRARFISQAPGAAFSAVGWFLFSYFFSLYVEYSPNFSVMYGSLTTIVLVMLWLYFCMYILLIGAEINSYFEAEFRRLTYYRKMMREKKQAERKSAEQESAE